MGIYYISNIVTQECLDKRNNHKHHFPSGIKKTFAIAGILKRKGFAVKLLSPSLVNNNTLRFFPSFDEKCKGFHIKHCTSFDLTGMHLIFAIMSALLILTTNRKDYDAVLFYNYRPETAIPALFCKIVLGKKLYLDYEDDLLLSDSRLLLKPIFYFIELICNLFLSGALVVNQNLNKRLRTSNVQTIEGLFNYKLFNDFSRIKKTMDDNRIFMYSGSLDNYRGINEYLNIADSLIKKARSNNRFEFWITGKGPLEEQVRVRCKKYTGKLKYYGFVPEDKLLELYKEVDCFIVFNDPDSRYNKGLFPSKLYEYVSTGKRVFFYGKTTLDLINFRQFDSLDDLETAMEELIKDVIYPLNLSIDDLKNSQDIFIFD